MTFGQSVKITISITTILVLAAIPLVIWHFIGKLDFEILQLLTTILILIIPIVLFATFKIGTTEARGMIAGIDKGIDRAAGMLDKALETQAKIMTQTKPPNVNILQANPEQLGMPSITHQLPSGTGEIVEIG